MRDFAIVLDTSESTSGELVKAFLKETFTLLKSADTFFAKCRVLVLQCDDAVRGGDFPDRPGFSGPLCPEFCAERAAAGRISARLLPASRSCGGKAACGSCRAPSTLPTAGAPTRPGGRATTTAFLFLDNGEPPPEVPPWAMRLVIEPEELIQPKAPALPPMDWAQDEMDDLPQL